MSTIHIEVSESSFEAIKKANIPHKVISNDVALEKFLKQTTDVAELNQHDFNQVLKTAKEAIETGLDRGLAINISSGRDNNDRRCYTLNYTSVVAHNNYNCVYTVAQLLKLKS